MERSQEYEPLILDLQKSQVVQRPKRFLLMSLMTIAIVSLVAASTFAVLYFTKPPPPSPTPTPRILTSATPVPETTPDTITEPTPLPEATPDTVTEPTPAPVITPTPQPVATTAQAETGLLTLYSSPDNAEVIIDGEVLGHTPLQNYELPVGTYTVKFAHEGTVSEYKITITAGETTEYTHQFQGFATLRIRTIPFDSNIYINGELAGRRSPVQINGLLSGTYTISARKSGYKSTEKTVVLKKEEQQEVLIIMKQLGLNGSDTTSPTPAPEHPSDRLERTN